MYYTLEAGANGMGVLNGALRAKAYGGWIGWAIPDYPSVMQGADAIIVKTSRTSQTGVCMHRVHQCVHALMKQRCVHAPSATVCAKS